MLPRTPMGSLWVTQLFVTTSRAQADAACGPSLCPARLVVLRRPRAQAPGLSCASVCGEQRAARRLALLAARPAGRDFLHTASGPAPLSFQPTTCRSVQRYSEEAALGLDLADYVDLACPGSAVFLSAVHHVSSSDRARGRTNPGLSPRRSGVDAAAVSVRCAAAGSLRRRHPRPTVAEARHAEAAYAEVVELR
jgi:hypothetical protein